MERLTVKRPDDEHAYCPPSAPCKTRCDDCKHMDKMMDKLAAYEEAEEQGLLLRLPCKVGDKAYYLHRVYLANAGVWIDEIDEVEVDSFVLNINLFVNVSYYIGSEAFRMTLTPYKTLFFTREEAEEALEKMKREVANGKCDKKL